MLEVALEPLEPNLDQPFFRGLYLIYILNKLNTKVVGPPFLTVTQVAAGSQMVQQQGDKHQS